MTFHPAPRMLGVVPHPHTGTQVQAQAEARTDTQTQAQCTVNKQLVTELQSGGPVASGAGGTSL